jgi:hypothetical protein
MRSENAYEDLGMTQRFMNLEWRPENAAPEVDVSSDSPAMRRLPSVRESGAEPDAVFVATPVVIWLDDRFLLGQRKGRNRPARGPARSGEPVLEP